MSRCPGKGAHNFWTGDTGVHPLLGKGMNNVHIALLPKKVTIPIWDKYVQMENMYVSITKCSVEMEKEKYKYHQKKRANTQRLSNLCQRRCCSTLRWCQSKECDRFPDSTTTQRDHRTSRILERAEQIQIQIQTYL